MKKINSIEDFNKRIKRILVTKEEIDEKIKEAGKWIDSIYDGKPIILVSILKGAFVFMADICRAVTVPCEVGFMCAKSYYEGTVSTGVVNITMDLDRDIKGCHVVIVEDIVDTGNTIVELKKIMQEAGAAESSICTLLYKPEAYKQDITLEYVAMESPNEFIIGFGLDYDELGRNFKDIYVLDK